MRHVLVTGATGVVGSTLVPMLLEEEGTQVSLIVRARSLAHLQERIEKLHRFWGWNESRRPLLERLHWLVGDVCRPRVGLDEQLYDNLAGQITHVIHAAGNVRLSQPLEDARRDAVESAREIVRFCRDCQSGGEFRKLDFVSTVGVAGRMSGVIPERRLHEPREFHNTYEQAKAEAEEFLFEEMERGLPATIHRPSMVVGHSETGKVISFQVFYHLCEFLSGRRTWGIVPKTGDAVLDTVPADYVARALQIASRDETTAGRVLHLASGPDAVRLGALTEMVREAFASAGRSVPRLQPVSARWFRAVLPVLSGLGTERTRRAVRTLPFFLAYLGERQVFGTQETSQYLKLQGKAVPILSAYLPGVLGAYLSAPAAAGPATKADLQEVAAKS